MQDTTTYDYDTLLDQILVNGRRVAGTRALYNKRYHIDLRPYQVEPNKHRIVIPESRGGIKTRTGYAVAESCWYANRDRDPSLIADGAPIWHSMKDDEGLVNSNYGYQLSVNNDFKNAVLMLTMAGRTDLDIISQDNMHSSSDLVCNNRVTLYLEKGESDGLFEISANVFARSIDMIFGLPFDMFMAQNLMAMIASELSSMYAESAFTLGDLVFEISNVHVYDNQPVQLIRSGYDRDGLLVCDFEGSPFDVDFDVFRDHGSLYDKNDIANFKESMRFDYQDLVKTNRVPKTDGKTDVCVLHSYEDVLFHLDEILEPCSLTYDKIDEMRPGRYELSDRKRAGIDVDGKITHVMNLDGIDTWAVTVRQPS